MIEYLQGRYVCPNLIGRKSAIAIVVRPFYYHRSKSILFGKIRSRRASVTMVNVNQSKVFVRTGLKLVRCTFASSFDYGLTKTKAKLQRRREEHSGKSPAVCQKLRRDQCEVWAYYIYHIQRVIFDEFVRKVSNSVVLLRKQNHSEWVNCIPLLIHILLLLLNYWHKTRSFERTNSDLIFSTHKHNVCCCIIFNILRDLCLFH